MQVLWIENYNHVNVSILLRNLALDYEFNLHKNFMINLIFRYFNAQFHNKKVINFEKLLKQTDKLYLNQNKCNQYRFFFHPKCNISTVYSNTIF